MDDVETEPEILLRSVAESLDVLQHGLVRVLVLQRVPHQSPSTTLRRLVAVDVKAGEDRTAGPWVWGIDCKTGLNSLPHSHRLRL